MDAILDNEFTFMTLLYGVIFMLAGLLYKLFPPKKMSWYYGVQTKSARRNQDTWREATLFIATPVIIIGLLFIGFAFLPFIFENAIIFNFRSASLLIFISLILLHLFTERHLNKLFDKRGNRIHNA
jgi:uncharacterized membrane protein